MMLVTRLPAAITTPSPARARAAASETRAAHRPQQRVQHAGEHDLDEDHGRLAGHAPPEEALAVGDVPGRGRGVPRHDERGAHQGRERVEDEDRQVQDAGEACQSTQPCRWKGGGRRWRLVCGLRGVVVEVRHVGCLPGSGCGGPGSGGEDDAAAGVAGGDVAEGVGRVAQVVGGVDDRAGRVRGPRSAGRPAAASGRSWVANSGRSRWRTTRGQQQRPRRTGSCRSGTEGSDHRPPRRSPRGRSSRRAADQPLATDEVDDEVEATRCGPMRSSRV